MIIIIQKNVKQVIFLFSLDYGNLENLKKKFSRFPQFFFIKKWKSPILFFCVFFSVHYSYQKRRRQVKLKRPHFSI